MELLRNQDRLNAINRFMEELEQKNHTLTKNQIYYKYESYLKDITPMDIFYLPWYQNDTLLSIDEIKETAGKFVNVFYHGLIEQQPKSYDSILFKMYLKENSLIEEHLNKIKPFFKESLLKVHKDEIYQHLILCYEFEKKYIKKEMILFSYLEKKLPTTKPFEVLWSLHDDARLTLKKLLKLLESDTIDIKEVIITIGEYYGLVYGINNKEELILFPVANMILTDHEKELIYEENKEYGYVFVKEDTTKTKQPIITNLSEGFISTKTGSLTISQFDAIMTAIPIDITYVDNMDRVLYFNDRIQRHFPRNPSIIGRLVKHCHPPKSVHIVEKIMDAFKKGEKEIAEFWITFNETFLYITYYAVLNDNKEYMGTLEVSQDVTRIRELTGEQKLLDWK
jgi:DUF438 domain-containing protein